MKTLTILSIIFTIAFLSSCAEEVTPPPSVSHPVEWNDKTADNFHGNKVRAVGNESCSTCHGADLQGGSSGIACHDCHENYPHPPGWGTPEYEHSNYLINNGWEIEECQSCHGEDYQGGSSGVSCYDCHDNYPHPPGWSTPEFEHKNYFKINTWEIEECQECHGEDYKGAGSDLKSCYNCHTGSQGPESCNVCHGEGAISDADTASWAPPQDLADNVSTDNIGVGAHQKHLRDTTYTTAYNRNCNLCHRVPTAFEDPRHRDGVIDIEFGAPATDNGDVTPQWHSAAATCSDTYCHGNFALGQNTAMVWNDVGSGQSDCGTCHGLPPQAPHLNIESCHFCHSSVVDEDKNIIDKTKHINGQTDY